MSNNINFKNSFIVFLIAFTSILVTSCNAQEKSDKSEKGISSNSKVTFVELGSVNCIPCKQMQPVMKSIEKKYGDQVNVIFYDVWTNEGKPYAAQYKIKLIPTQVFLDENGKEFHRHEGFYPEEEIEKILMSKNLKPRG